jgi:hypothetical protein
MRNFVLSITGILMFGALAASAGEDKPDLSGTWKLKQETSEAGQTNKNLVLVIEEKGDDIHVKETRGSSSKDAISDFTCATLGKECAMQDGGDKAKVSVYYNGPVLVVLKTHGRKGDSVEKRRLSLSPAGDSLTVEVIHIEPAGKAEKLVFAKAD